MKGLLGFHGYCLDVKNDGKRHIFDEFITPGFWVALTAYCKAEKIKSSEFKFYRIEHLDYLSAIGFMEILDGTDNYPYERKNAGVTYSPLVAIISKETTDKANSVINNCIRNLFNSAELGDFVKALCEAVGDLHDNVWSHGKKTGFSIAQKWNDYQTKNDMFEFALADCGLGFLSELGRTGISKKYSIANDEDAINWCIQEGNSSKKQENQDSWMQRLPEDITGKPMPNAGYIDENHHMGLGLAKLVSLVTNYKGQLWLSSGNKTLFINTDGSRVFCSNKRSWQGVALSCRFNIEEAKTYRKPNDDEAIISITELLRMSL